MFYIYGESRGGYVALPQKPNERSHWMTFCAVATSTPDNNDLQSDVELPVLQHMVTVNSLMHTRQQYKLVELMKVDLD